MADRDFYSKGIDFDVQGTIIQIEHAKEAVRKEMPTVGIVFDGGVVLIVLKKTERKLVLRDSIQKIFQIDNRIVVSASGLIPDASKLAEQARLDATDYQKTFNESIGIEELAKELGSIMQSHTQCFGVRIFGVSLLVAGVENCQPRLFEIDPDGLVLEYLATSIGGEKNEERIIILENRWHEKITEEEAITLGVDVLIGTLKENPVFTTAEGCVITAKGFKKIPFYEMDKYVEKTIKKIEEEIGKK